MSEAGLHISLGVGLRLFKLLEHDLQIIDLKIALQSDPALLSQAEQQLISLIRKAQCLEDKADAMLEEAEHHQVVHEWFSVSAEPCEDDLPADVQLADLHALIQNLHKSAKTMVNYNPFCALPYDCVKDQNTLTLYIL